MKTRLLDHDAATATTSYFHFDDTNNSFVISEHQDVTALVEANVRARNATEKHTRYGDGMHQVAHLPNTVIMEMAKQGICTPAFRILDHAKLRRWLNSSENLKWRTRFGYV